MRCSECEEKAVIEHPQLCKNHFQTYVEETVKDTIERFNLVDEDDSVCVAASGGKDSITILYILNKLGYDVEALAVDEGIHVYRDRTIRFLNEFCEYNNIPLNVVSYEEEIGNKLEDIVPDDQPACNMCGTFRRHLLNQYSQGYDKIATGHNLDDESQAILMNIVNAQTELFARQGPKTKQVEGFTQKIKPLYLLKEKEIMVYAYLKDFAVGFQECPFAQESFRANLRDVLNSYESSHYGTKKNVVKKYLSIRDDMVDVDEKVEDVNTCNECGSPCSGETCKFCQYKAKVQA